MWVRDMADESSLTAAELSSKIVSDITIYTKYAKYKEDLKRRTNWNEIVREVVDMHKRKYPALSNEIDAAFQFVIDKKVIPSMRSMQFAGKAIELGESRIYNCAFLPIDNRIAFREVMFLLMGGTGVGYSVQKHHIAKLPAIKQPESTHRFIISDTAEGWSDAVNRLCKAYFEGKSRPIFNYNDIRPEGSPLKKSGGKAPGPAKLKRTLNSIDNILRNAIGRKLSTVEVHDIVCYIASCVVSGGIRDSAMIALFSHDDNEMATCKGNFPVKVVEETASHIQVELDLDLAKQDQIGINAYGLNNYFFNKAELGDAEIKSIKTDGKMPWYYFHPQRGKANNSALLVRGDTTREEFFALWEKTKSSGAGEPAAYWSSSTEWGTNPSLRRGTLVLTDSGIIPIEELQDREFLVKNLHGAWSKARCWLSGKNKRLYKLTLEDGSEYYATPEHKWPVLQKPNMRDAYSNGGWEKKTTDKLKAGMILPVGRNTEIRHNNKGYIGDREDGFFAGWLYGDGWITNRIESRDKCEFGLCVSRSDVESGGQIIIDRLESYIKNRLKSESSFRWRPDRGLFETSINSDSARLHLAKFGIGPKSAGIPKSILTLASDEFIKGFIDGIVSSDGSVSLHDSTNSDAYSLDIVTIHEKLAQDLRTLLGFYGITSKIHPRKMTEQVTFPNGIVSTPSQAYSLRISNNNNLHWFANVFDVTHESKQKKLEKYVLMSPKDRGIKIVSVELSDVCEDVWDISVYDKSHCFQIATCITGNCVEIALRPFQFCNLTSVNAATVTSQQDFEARVRAAAFIGTLQAGYTNFHYLRDIWRETTEKEALLGVSITGIAYNRLQGIDLAAAAKVGLAENERVASLIGIKKAARLACIKPEGSGSLALGVFGAGIHSIYDRFFIRRIRYNANDRLHQYLKQHVPKLVELDKFDSNKGIISIPVCAPEAGIFRNETAIEFCERVKKFSQEWVKSGHRRGQNTHNVSATIYVKPDEWEDLGRWMWDNKEYYNGLSCLPYDGGTYIQAPYEVISKEQYQAMLGNIHSIDLDNIMEDDDFTTLAAEKACAGGLCEF